MIYTLQLKASHHHGEERLVIDSDSVFDVVSLYLAAEKSVHFLEGSVTNNMEKPGIPFMYFENSADPFDCRPRPHKSVGV